MTRRNHAPVFNLSPVEQVVTPDQILRALKRHPFTGELPERFLSMLSALARQVVFQQDEVILRAGYRSPYLYLLVSGGVCVEIRTPFFAVCVEGVGPGEAFGWSSLLDGHDTVFQVRARETSTALRLDAEPLASVCRENPELGFEIFRRLVGLVAERVKATEARLAEFCGVSCGVRPRQAENCSPRP